MRLSRDIITCGYPLLHPGRYSPCSYNLGMDNENENKVKDSAYQEGEDKLNSIDLNDPDEQAELIEAFLQERDVICM